MAKPTSSESPIIHGGGASQTWTLSFREDEVFSAIMEVTATYGLHELFIPDRNIKIWKAIKEIAESKVKELETLICEKARGTESV